VFRVRKHLMNLSGSARKFMEEHRGSTVKGLKLGSKIPIYRIDNLIFPDVKGQDVQQFS
jgi:hypothetical protein